MYYELNETEALGRERLSTLGNGLNEDRTYDRATGFLSSIETGPSLTATVQNLQFQWDTLGNLTQREDLNQGTLNETFTYDSLSRLDIVKRNGTQSLNVDNNNLGNITVKSDVGSYTYGGSNGGPNAVGLHRMLTTFPHKPVSTDDPASRP